MCEFSGKLIGWFDGELTACEGAQFEQHVRSCSECAGKLEAYKQVSADISTYCDAAMEANSPSMAPWRIVASAGVAAGVASIVAALFLIVPHVRVQPNRATAPAAVASMPIVRYAEPSHAVSGRAAVLGKTVHRRQFASVAIPQQDGAPRVAWLSAEPAVQITIPAEAMFPPGAVPEGASFTADLTIAADGSAQRLHLRP